jgi:hypothetical protein
MPGTVSVYFAFSYHAMLMCDSSLFVFFFGYFAFVPIMSAAVGEINLMGTLRLGFGADTTNLRLSWGPGLENNFIGNVIMANLGQILFSVLYLSYNNAITSMSLAHEWNSFGVRRKGLRVSSKPKGAQRSTYFLSLPYRFGIPLLVFSCTMHWFLSESIFYVGVHAYHRDGTRDPANDINAAGYSPAPIFCLMLMVITMTFVTQGMVFWKVKARLPLASTCSALIAAACHPCPSLEKYAAFQSLSLQMITLSDQDGYLAFSTEDVVNQDKKKEDIDGSEDVEALLPS